MDRLVENSTLTRLYQAYDSKLRAGTNSLVSMLHTGNVAVHDDAANK